MLELLAGLHRFEDLAALVRAAGHEPGIQELPPDCWPLIPTPRRLAVLGQYQGFEWIGVETAGSPASAAARLARLLERAGRMAAVLALAPESRTVAISVSLDPRPVLSVELDAPSRLALHCLERLSGAAANGALGAAAHLVQALDADHVGRRFFARFRATLDDCLTALPARIPRADRHALALLQLTRVLFLYFVQARGWLDGRASFLRDELDRALGAGEPLHRTLFRPLFFGTLNQPLERRRLTARRFGRIPFLNGGLFEPHPLERRWPVDLGDEIWRSAFDNLFERFHFAGSGDDPEVIAPDMLGRVFEGVMDPEERQLSGTFYTPTPLVLALVRAGLAAYLEARLGSAGDPERRLADPDPVTQAALAAVTILDPAVGSGAFLLGALQILSEAAPEDRFRARRRILASNLFGVDLNPAAVRLTELRLWLALIEADPSGDPAQVEPLPNLDGMVRQGDALVDPLLPAWLPASSHPAASRVRELRRSLCDARGPEKARAVGALRRAESVLLQASLGAAENAIQARIEDLLALANAPTLFGPRPGLPRRLAASLADLRGRRRFLQRLRHRLSRDHALPWFHFQSQFPDVFEASGGFDVVMGNPPWVRAEHVPALLRAQLTARYRWWSTRDGGVGYRHQPDLCIAFLERAHELAGPRGSLAFLLPGKLATASYATGARSALATTATLRVLADLTSDPRACFEATTYPMALVATKSAPPVGHRIRRGLDPGSATDLPQERLSGGPWILLPDDIGGALEAVRRNHPTLADRFRPHLGVKTGLNQVFLDPPETLEPELLYWALRGRDIGAFSSAPSCRLLWTHGPDGRPLEVLPPRARAWIERHRDQLVRRKDFDAGPAWTLFRVKPAIAPHRVVWADLAPRLEAVALNGPHGERLIPLNTCYVIAAPDPVAANRLAAWLNCTWVRAAAAAVADPASGGFRRFNARVTASLPLPEGVLRDPALEQAAEAGREGRLAQSDLDDVCNRLLGLSPSERRGLATVVAGGRRHRR